MIRKNKDPIAAVSLASCIAHVLECIAELTPQEQERQRLKP